MGQYAGLEEAIGYAFNDEALLRRALTHSSYANERNLRHGGGKPDIDSRVQHNEMLEFLGDSILGFVVAEILFFEKPDDNEGGLTQRRADIICEQALAAGARAIGLGEHMLLGSNMEGGKNRDLNSILSDAMEAIFAAAYLDGGVTAARAVIARCMDRAIGEAASRKKITDYKSRLQEHFFATDKNVSITYTVTSEDGPPHRRSFISQVAVNGRVLGASSGSTKKESERNAAREAYAGINPQKRDLRINASEEN
jgi:ribonuclease-3